jgi:hypothetical protein
MHDLGFSPHEDNAPTSWMLGSGESTACPTRFEYGHTGKPFYVSGPHKTAAQVRAIVEQPRRSLGTGNSDHLVLDH